MATTTTYTWSDLPRSEGPDSSAPTMSLVPASLPTSRPISPSTSTDSSSANLTPLSSAAAGEISSPTPPIPATILPTFHSFPLLPREIQLIIWDFAIVSTGATEKYEPYQLLIPAWKYFSTQPWHKGLRCCVPKRKVLRDMIGSNRRWEIENVALNRNEAGREVMGYWDGKEEAGRIGWQARGKAGKGSPSAEDEEQMWKRSAHPHVHAVGCDKTIYLSPGWARSGLGGIANSCLTGRWLVMEYMRNVLEGFESGCLKVEKEHVLAVLTEVVEDMDGRLRGWWKEREGRVVPL